MLASAAARWPQDAGPLASTLAFSMTYFYKDAAPDVDNMIKPVQDSLIGLVYEDDSQIIDTRSTKYNIANTGLRTSFRDALSSFYTYSDFIHVIISSKPLDYPHQVTL